MEIKPTKLKSKRHKKLQNFAARMTISNMKKHNHMISQLSKLKRLKIKKNIYKYDTYVLIHIFIKDDYLY